MIFQCHLNENMIMIATDLFVFIIPIKLIINITIDCIILKTSVRF